MLISQNTNGPSILSEDRRVLISLLVGQITTNGHDVRETDKLAGLQADCYAMEEVLQEIAQVGHVIDYYNHIDKAFELLISNEPGAFRTYKMLTAMFRIFSKHQNVIYDKLNEVSRLISDLDIIESEN